MLIIIVNIKTNTIDKLVLNFMHDTLHLDIDIDESGGLTATLIVTLCNVSLNPITKLITKYENYDFINEKNLQETWRIWIGKMTNLCIFVIIQT